MIADANDSTENQRVEYFEDVGNAVGEYCDGAFGVFFFVFALD